MRADPDGRAGQADQADPWNPRARACLLSIGFQKGTYRDPEAHPDAKPDFSRFTNTMRDLREWRIEVQIQQLIRLPQSIPCTVVSLIDVNSCSVRINCSRRVLHLHEFLWITCQTIHLGKYRQIVNE